MEEIKDILRRLFICKVIGGKHTPERRVLRWFSYLPLEKKKLAEDEWRTCVKTGLVLRMKKTGEWHVTLNPRKISDIQQMISQEKQ